MKTIYKEHKKIIQNGEVDLNDIKYEAIKCIVVDFPGKKARRTPKPTMNMVKNFLEFTSKKPELVIAGPFIASSMITRDTEDYVDNNDFESMTIILNGHQRFFPRPPDYFKYDQAFLHQFPSSFDHTYIYSFAMKPLDDNPSGSVNFTKINNKNLVFTGVKEGTEVFVTFIIFEKASK